LQFPQDAHDQNEDNSPSDIFSYVEFEVFQVHFFPLTSAVIARLTAVSSDSTGGISIKVTKQFAS
jgi:hypothetical protein